MQAESQAAPVQCRAKHALGSSVASTDARHVPTAVLPGDPIHQVLLRDGERRKIPATTRAIRIASRGGTALPDLAILLGPWAAEEVVIRKRLQTCCLAYGQTAALRRVGVNEVMTVLRDVSGDSCCGVADSLHSKPVSKEPFRYRSSMFRCFGRSGDGNSLILG